MSSTILYKFRASSTFEALPLPGSAARLFDVKKAIVKANKLDAGSMEFDLSVRNADTNEEYVNESMLLPRGTRIIVQRLPAARGHGFLARMARNEHAGGTAAPSGGTQNQSGYYTIDSRTRDDDEFVSSSSGPGGNNDEKELESLQAAIAMQPDGPTMTGGATGGHRRGGQPQPAGMGGPQGGGPKGNFHKPPPSHSRPNADPELREQEKKMQPKKRATGIPRTFLSLSAPPQTEANKDGETEQQPLLQPNRIGFEELVSRGGGQSESSARAKSLDYALKITSTTVPDHLQCAICQNVVKNAMLLPWDTEGRTVCDACIRDALTQNGFRCPLTGMDGVSPDDLIPNVGLRKAAELFIKSVMEKVDEIENQQVEDNATAADETNAQSTEINILDGEGVDKGVIVSKKTSLTSRKREDDDPFGGGDIFGGDVFAVEVKKDEKVDVEEPTSSKDQKGGESSEPSATAETGSRPAGAAAEGIDDSTKQATKDVTDAVLSEETGSAKDRSALDGSTKDRSNSVDASTNNDKSSSDIPSTLEQPRASPVPARASSHRRGFRRRGPPAGYSIGPAVGSARVNQQARNNNVNNQNGGDGRGQVKSPRGGGGGGGRHGDSHHQGRGSSGRGNGSERGPPGRPDDHQEGNDKNDRGKKRRRDEQRRKQDGPPPGRGPPPGYGGPPGRGGFPPFPPSPGFDGHHQGRGYPGPPPAGRGFPGPPPGRGGRFFPPDDFGGRFGGRGGGGRGRGRDGGRGRGRGRR